MIEDSLLQGSSNMSTTEASASASAATAGGEVSGKSGRRRADPRNEDFIIKYEKENFSKGGEQEGGMAELYQLLSVVIGMVAFMTRHKAACWVALFFYYSSSINAKSDSRL